MVSKDNLLPLIPLNKMGSLKERIEHFLMLS
jgi:hypothetical protein